MTDRFEELRRRKKLLQQELRRRQVFPRQRKRFDRDDDERRFREFVETECERRELDRRDIERECDELYERKFRQLERERDELLEREQQRIDVQYEELFDREYKRIERQISQRVQRETAKDQKPQNLVQYLETCHALHLRFQKTASRSLITQKEALSWTFPRRIIPWDGFPRLQEGVWQRILSDSAFCKEPRFPSIQQLEAVKRTLTPVNSEASLQHFGRYAIENVVQEMMDQLYEDGLLWNGLGLSDDIKVTIETDKDLGQVFEPMLESSWHKGANELKISMRNSHRRAKRAGIWVNRSCVYRHDEDRGEKTPIFAFEGDDFTFASKTLVAATITQLYSYMISKEIQYGCVCTGEAFIFCCISEDDPCTIYCTPCMPEREVMPDDPARLHRSAGALVFGLVLQALRSRPLPASWCDSVTYMDTWTMGYDDRAYEDTTESIASAPTSIQDQPYCSQKCLLGLVQGKSLDKNCPNAEFHGPAHLDYDDFLSLLRTQLDQDDNLDADCTPLRVANVPKSLFKMRLTSHGYTFIAKAGKNSAYLWSEKFVYDQMANLQGRCIPVCIGMMELIKPRRHNNRALKDLLLLSWAGRPFLNCSKQVTKEQIARMMEMGIEAIHKVGVVYNGGHIPSNFLYDASRNSVMIVDFEEASLEFTKTPAVVGDSQMRKRKRDRWQEDARRVFEEDTDCAVTTIMKSMPRKTSSRFADDESEVGDDSVSRCC
ncbi:hypothetical protein M431DRAFT_71632 [Trichoderma harzianum CBS 226.95]|uniref:Protein kinase domain-containing protein n=1 Tax=Trichoderma harzianum CBS 226.95 TaxID=983964 RepID=A0A2T4ASV4_TRIHA|nr:hypothetical protein M431DRAFT_71632 [Trichoderma harzianum CBS 226.95]PTB60136.1 hypothetical protein M431DRAFT_71632 [Trichoderma harzianum CBS 226.95]